MLVVTRKNREGVTLKIGPGGLPEGSEISMKVLQLKGERAKLGFEGPPSVKILRNELLGRNLTPAA